MSEPRELPATLGFRKFAELQGWRPSYVTELKGKGHLVLTEDGRQVRVPESLALLADLRDPAKKGLEFARNKPLLTTGILAGAAVLLGGLGRRR